MAGVPTCGLVQGRDVPQRMCVCLCGEKKREGPRDSNAGMKQMLI